MTFSRFSWVAAHLGQLIWWSGSLNLFLYWIWLWVLDGIGIVQNDPFRLILAGKDFGEKGLTDDWINSNTWTLKLSMTALENGLGEPFDIKNEIHMKLFKDFTWPYLYETLNLVNTYEASTFITNSILFYFIPSLYVDEKGFAKDGYPMLVATSHELSKMYQGEYTWLETTEKTELKID